MPVFFMPAITVKLITPVLVEAVIIPAGTTIIIDVTVSEAIRPPVDRLGFTPVKQAESECRG